MIGLKMIMNLRLMLLPKADVVIYDDVGAYYINQCIPDNNHVYVFKVRRRIIFVDLRLIPYIIYGLCQRFGKNNKYWMRASLRVIYEYAVLKIIKPKIITTFVDNSSRFNLLSRLLTSIRFMGVQNGYRATEIKEMSNYLCLTELFCFGRETKDNYLKYGCDVGRYHIIGSLKDGLYREQIQPITDGQRYDICFISQYRPSRFEESMPMLRENTENILNLLIRFSKEQGKTICIAGSCKPSEAKLEENYYRNAMEDALYDFICNDEYKYSSYSLIDRSEVSVTVNSTVGIESVGRGKKVLFCNLSDDKYYNLPSHIGKGLWVLDKRAKSYQVFSARLSHILDIRPDEWWTTVSENVEYLIHCSNDILPQESISYEMIKTLETKI